MLCAVIGGYEIFEEFKGLHAEQYVCRQLVSNCGAMPGGVHSKQIRRRCPSGRHSF